MREIFAKRLKARQTQLGLNQSQLAEKINVVPRTCSAYLNMEKVPTLEKAAEIAAALGVTVGWLCGEDIPSIETVRTQISCADVAKAIVNIESFELPGIVVKVSYRPLADFCALHKRVKALVRSNLLDAEVYHEWMKKKLEDLSGVAVVDD